MNTLKDYNDVIAWLKVVSEKIVAAIKEFYTWFKGWQGTFEDAAEE